jgi:DNA (cytosine-5)-methyltransferase 1
MGLRIGSLFSGIGGLELGLEWAGVGHTVWQCERDPFARDTLAAHWPGVPCYHDVQALDAADLEPIDLLCGGFPCQDTSTANAHGSRAGTRRGTESDRSGLWHDMARLAAELQPEWIVVENVSRGQAAWLPRVRGDLGGLGYQTLPVQLEARFVGAPHRRARIFVLAHSDRNALRLDQQRVPGGRPRSLRHGGHALGVERGDAGRWQAEPPMAVVEDGIPDGMGGATWRAIGNACVPQCAEVIGHMIRELSR